MLFTTFAVGKTTRIHQSEHRLGGGRRKRGGKGREAGEERVIYTQRERERDRQTHTYTYTYTHTQTQTHTHTHTPVRCTARYT